MYSCINPLSCVLWRVIGGGHANIHQRQEHDAPGLPWTSYHGNSAVKKYKVKLCLAAVSDPTRNCNCKKMQKLIINQIWCCMSPTRNNAHVCILMHLYQTKSKVKGVSIRWSLYTIILICKSLLSYAVLHIALRLTVGLTDVQLMVLCCLLYVLLFTDLIWCQVTLSAMKGAIK